MIHRGCTAKKHIKVPNKARHVDFNANLYSLAHLCMVSSYTSISVTGLKFGLDKKLRDQKCISESVAPFTDRLEF